MRYSEVREKTKNELLILYWVNLVLLVMISIILLVNIGIKGESETENDFIVERFGIIFILVVIPLALKFYHNKHNIIREKDVETYLKRMKRIYLWRLFAIDFAILFNLIGFYCIEALNFMYLALIGMVAFFVCYPSIDIDNNIKENI